MQQTIEGDAAPRYNGGRRFLQSEREQNDKLVIHVASIPPMMPEEVVKQAALQFGPVKDFFKVTKHYERAYEYTPCFGFLTFEDEASAARALQAGHMSIGDTRLNINPRRQRNDCRVQSHTRPGTEVRGNNPPQGPPILPDRPTIRGQGPMHVKRQSIGSQLDQKRPPSGSQKPRNGSSTCTVYGLPDSFAVQDLTAKGNLQGRVINTHIFEYKDREGRRFGTLNFDSSVGAEEFYKKENGQDWGGSLVKITFEPFNIARRNNTPLGRQGQVNNHQPYQRHDQKPSDGQKRFQGGNRGQRYQPNQGRFNQRGGFPHHGNFHSQSPYQMQPHLQPHYPPPESQFYEPQMMGFPQYHPQYPPMANPPHMPSQGQYGSIGVISPPSMGYINQPASVPTMQGPFHSPPLLQGPVSTHPHSVGSQISYSNTTDYPHRFDGCKNTTIDESLMSKRSSISNGTPGVRNVHGEAPLKVPTVGSESEAPTKQSSEGRYPLVIKPENYFQAGYAYGSQLPENVHPLNAHHTRQQTRVVDKSPTEASAPVSVPETKDPEDPSNIFIKNIDDDLISKPEHLEAYCRKFGDVVSISLPTYPNGLIKGFGFVKFTCAEQALKAKEELNLKMVGRRRMFVSFAETSDHRHNRLAKFYDQGVRDGVLRSPPDPLIPKIAETKEGDEEGEQEESTVAAKNGDATSDTPEEKVVAKPINTKVGNEVRKENDAATSSSDRSTEAVTASGENRNPTGVIKAENAGPAIAAKRRKLSAEELIVLDPAIKSIGKKPIGRRLSAEELRKNDPAIQFIGRPQSTESPGAVILSSRGPSPPGIHTPNNYSTELKAERLQQLLYGLQISDLGSLNSSSSGGEVPKRADVSQKSGHPCEENRLKEAIFKALRTAQEREEARDSDGKLDDPVFNEDGKNDDGVVFHDSTRPETRNSGSSAGSRVSREEFSEALREKFGGSIPPTIRATDVLDAVDQYVLSRSTSQRSSPTDNVGNPKLVGGEGVGQPTEHQAANEASNIVAPAPSRKVSVQRITPNDAADEVLAKTGETKVNRDQEDEAGGSQETGKEHKAASKPKASSKKIDQAVDEDFNPSGVPQNTLVSEMRDLKSRNFERGPTGMKRNPGPSKQAFYSGPAFQRPSRNNHASHGTIDPNYRYAPPKADTFSQPPVAGYPRAPEQPGSLHHSHGSLEDRAHLNANANLGNVYTSAPPHPPTIICEGPCCQPAYSPRYPPHEVQGGMFPSQVPGPMPGPIGQVPYFDPGMFHSRPYYGMDNGAFPMLSGPGTFPYPQWGSTPNGHPNMPYPHGGFPMIPAGPRYSPPHATHTSPRMAGLEQGNQNRGYQEYGQYPPQMPQNYGGPMFYEPGMPAGPPQFHTPGYYRPPQNGTNVHTF
ncbi:hypothetical protein DRE_06299 [Drechslerella stenobrocha 248]|uniref:RRM domain-containing protein n=1 Tax=Drechslerella stenobrocha 248 TaxID=1043628 RepID=W7HPF7_9PEZI|nr:hypothetical protein DRE_06299 [Drechslerella stenobrocha 248]